MEIPKSLIKLAKEIREKRGEKIIAEIVANVERKRIERKKTEDRIKAGIKYARKIFKWVKKFERSDDGLKIIHTGVKHRYREGIFFFDAKVPGFDWRGLGVSEKGLWWTYNGCGAREQYVKTSKELASQVESEILKVACETLEDGRVWKCIAERISD